jgi:hypothetical protein
MYTKDVHKYNAGERVKVFFAGRPDLAPAGSKTAGLVDRLKTVLGSIAGLFTDYEAASSRWQQAGVARGQILGLVSQDARTVQRTVKALASAPPDAAAKFRVHNRGAQGVLAGSRALVAHARTMTPDLEVHNLPAAFLSTLEERIAAHDAAADDQNSARGAKIAVRAQLDQAISGLMDVLKQLDVITRNQLRNDPAALAAWTKARHIESGPIPAAAVPETPAPAPATTTKTA